MRLSYLTYFNRKEKTEWIEKKNNYIHNYESRINTIIKIFFWDTNNKVQNCICCQPVEIIFS